VRLDLQGQRDSQACQEKQARLVQLDQQVQMEPTVLMGLQDPKVQLAL
jgi:hypothetical protein